MKKWCRHIKWEDNNIPLFSKWILQSNKQIWDRQAVSDNWNLCPICGILRPGLIYNNQGKIVKLTKS